MLSSAWQTSKVGVQAERRKIDLSLDGNCLLSNQVSRVPIPCAHKGVESAFQEKT